MKYFKNSNRFEGATIQQTLGRARVFSQRLGDALRRSATEPVDDRCAHTTQI